MCQDVVEKFQASSIFRDRAVVPSRAVSTQKPSSGSNAAAVISGCLVGFLRLKGPEVEPRVSGVFCGEA